MQRTQQSELLLQGGVCGTDWNKEQGAIKGCEVYYDQHADHFKLTDEEGRFKNNAFKVAIIAFNKGEPYVAISKTTYSGPYMTINIPDWAACFMLIDHRGYREDMYECIGKSATFKDFPKMGGTWVCRNG